MSESAGERIILDRDGKPMTALFWDDGTQAAKEQSDLASVACKLTMERLEFWLQRFTTSACYHESRVLQEEIDKRDPSGFRGTMFEGIPEERLWE